MSSEDEELIKQQTDPSHNQWGEREPKGGHNNGKSRNRCLYI